MPVTRLLHRKSALLVAGLLFLLPGAPGSRADESYALIDRTGHFEVTGSPGFRAAGAAERAMIRPILEALEDRFPALVHYAPDLAGLGTIRIRIVTSEEMRALNRWRPLPIFGLVDRSRNLVEGVGNVLYLNLAEADVAGNVHRLAHDVQHLWMNRVYERSELWLNEGLAELVAGRITGVRWRLATEEFRKVGRSRPLRVLEIERYDLAAYGGSLLFMTFLWERWGMPLLRSLQRSRTLDVPAIESATGVGIDELEASFRRELFGAGP
jgi:hypothetical protein